MAYGTNAPSGLRALNSITGGTWVERSNIYQIPAQYGVSIFSGDAVVLNPTMALRDTIGVYNPTFRQTAANAPNEFNGTAQILGVFQSCEYIDSTNRTLKQSQYWPSGTAALAGTPINAFINDDPTTVWDVQVSTYINAAANTNDFAGGHVAGASAAPYFPGFSTANGQTALTSAIGSNFSIMGGGGTNFNTIPNPAGGFYNNNPTSTFVGVADGNDITDMGTNPYGGNVFTGQSGAYLCVSTFGNNNGATTFEGTGVINTAKNYTHTTATLPFKVIGLTKHPKNIAAPGRTLETTPFLNVMVMINNHVHKSGVPGLTFA